MSYKSYKSYKSYRTITKIFRREFYVFDVG
jgi:hypothetical protein